MHGNKTSHYRYLPLLLLLLCCAENLVAQNEAATYQIDSMVYNYYQKCKTNLKSPVVLLMSDTLFQMAGAKSDLRMQAVALSTKVDYYYFQGTNEDSIIAYVNQVKKFARKTNQPKYYYFIWGKRLIFYYIKRGQNNLALFEADKMLKEAEAEDYKEGIATCYSCLSSIYIIKGIASRSMQYQLKEIELHEKYNLENYNVALLYAEVGQQYLANKDLKKASEMFKKAVATVTASSQVIKVKLKYVEYYLAIKDTATAWKLIQESRAAIGKDKGFVPYMNVLHEAELKYYNATKQYTQALATAETLLNNSSTETTSHVNMILNKGNIYWNLNRKEEAANCYQAYIQAEKEVKTENEEIATGEFAALLNIEQLNAEKNEIKHQAQQKQLENTRTTLLLLATLLVIALIFFYRENLLNKKLKHSKDELIEKNQILQQSQQELSQAKEVAEKASRMKTSFIQNMSHEIRTPLNSIVGFSQVLTNFYSDSEEAREYSEIIERNSNMLLKLITDVLCLADLDQMENPINSITTDINHCCQLSVELTLPQVKQGVLLLFEPPCPKLLTQTNPEQVSQILMNLLSNAAKFTTSGEIVLSYTLLEANQVIIFTVTDTGIGIPVEQQEQVFERFFKQNDFEQGCGLGLPISRKIAEKLGGRLTVDSSYQGGARLMLTLPYNPV